MSHNWKVTEDTATLVHRRVSPDGLVQLGLVPLTFDVRVRAGWVLFDGTWVWDWSAGEDWEKVSTLYSQAFNLLAHHYRPGATPSVLERFPAQPALSPWYRDIEFARAVREGLVTPVTHILTPPPAVLRQCWARATSAPRPVRS